MIKKVVLLSLCYLLFSPQFYSQSLDTISLYFDIDKYDITQQHILKLNDLLNKNDAIDIEIYGYADFLGNIEYNKELSNKRCNSIKSYLVSQGINNDKIAVWSGRGVHSESSVEKRKDIYDPGIKEHRKVEIIYGKFKPVEEEPIVIDIVKLEEAGQDKYKVENWEVGENIVFEDILFYGGRSTFKPESTRALRQLELLMQHNPDLEIEIQGYVCCAKGKEDGYDDDYKDYNLSSNRARAVYHYLISNGIDENRMSFKGYGAQKKRYPKEKNEQERNMNRRVEILVVNK